MNRFFTVLVTCILCMTCSASSTCHRNEIAKYDHNIAVGRIAEKLYNALSCKENSMIIGISKNHELLLDELTFLVAALSIKYSNRSYHRISDIFIETIQYCHRFYTNMLMSVYHQFIDALQKIPRYEHSQKVEFLVDIFMESNVTARYFIILKNILKERGIDVLQLGDCDRTDIEAYIKLFFDNRLIEFNNKLCQIQKCCNDCFKFIIFNEYFFSKTPLLSEEIEILNKILSFLHSPNVLIIYNVLAVRNSVPTTHEKHNFIELFFQRDVVFDHGIGDFYTTHFIKNRDFSSILQNYTLFSINSEDVAGYFKGSYCEEHDASMLSGSCFAFGDYEIHSLNDSNMIGQTVRSCCCSRICLDNQVTSQIEHNHHEEKLFSFIQSNTLNRNSISAGCNSKLYVVCDASHGTNVFINQIGNGVKEAQIIGEKTVKLIDFEKHLPKDTKCDILNSIREDVIVLRQGSV